MIMYLLRRVLVMIPTLLVISVVAFIIIQLPPGDYLTIYMAQLREQGDLVDELVINRLQQRYGLGQPMYVQYFKWISGILLRNDWGDSMYYNMPVKDVIGDRVTLTFVLSFSTMIFSWLISIPVGVYSATHQYSIFDYIITAVNFVGRGIPEFMLALVIMWFAMSKLGMSVGGLFSPQFITAPWSWAKVVDMLKHIWQPMVILAVGSTAGGIPTTRANLLDELNKPYVETARGQGHHRAQAPVEVPRARFYEPPLLDAGLDPGGPDLGHHDRLHRSESQNDGADAVPGPDHPGHVPGRELHPVAEHSDCDRYPAVRLLARLGRSAHPARVGE